MLLSQACHSRKIICLPPLRCETLEYPPPTPRLHLRVPQWLVGYSESSVYVFQAVWFPVRRRLLWMSNHLTTKRSRTYLGGIGWEVKLVDGERTSRPQHQSLRPNLGQRLRHHSISVRSAGRLTQRHLSLKLGEYCERRQRLYGGDGRQKYCQTRAELEKER